MNQGLHAVVIAGGSGTRFWPLSRRHRPKQLLSLGGEATLLAATFGRIASIAPPERWWMVVGRPHADACRSAVPAAHAIVEPQGRNTAPAIGLAAVHLMAKEPGAVMVVLPADHHVADPQALCHALELAAEVALAGSIATLGIMPVRPDTGYGYIQRGEPDRRVAGAYRVQRFCEKPNVERARGFLSQGGFDWNAGIFVMKAETVLAEIERQLPAMHHALMRVRDALGTEAYEATLEAAFAEMQSISIDYGVMEGAEAVSVVPVSCGWSDVGSFGALDSVIAKDALGNVKQGRVIDIDSKDCVLYAGDNQVLAAIGVRDLAIVQTADATLVVPLDRAQDVRAVLERIGEKGWKQYL